MLAGDSGRSAGRKVGRMSSDNPNPDQAQAKIALALGRLRGDVMPPITSQAAPRLQDPATPTAVNAPAPNVPTPTGPSSVQSMSSGANPRVYPSLNPHLAQPAPGAMGPGAMGPSISANMGGPVANSLNTNLQSTGLG